MEGLVPAQTMAPSMTTVFSTSAFNVFILLDKNKAAALRTLIEEKMSKAIICF